MTAFQWPHVTVTGLPAGLSAHPAVVTIEVLLFGYFFVVNVIDFALIAISLHNLPAFMKIGHADTLRGMTMSFATPVSVLLPVFNESPHVESVIESLLGMRYPQHEVIVVNDGSTDDTLARLTQLYGLVPIPNASPARFRTKAVRAVYRSTRRPNLRVVDKVNGGKGDALNAGINESRYPLLLAADGDSIYAPDALEQMAQTFLTDPSTVGCGAGLRVANEAEIVNGQPRHKRLPRNLLLRFQIVEYLRAGLISRFAWAPLNGIMCVSGACALWRKDVVVAVGGYATNTVWEDAEMTVRVHHYMRLTRTRYRIAFVPAGVCWTTAPQTLGALRAQRISWHRHITEAITKHRNMLFRPYAGAVGWFALPAYVMNEWLAPIWLLLGVGFLAAAALLGIISWEAQLALLAAVLAFTTLKMALAFLLDEMSYRTHSPREMWSLFWAAILEQIGYRQLLSWWSIVGIVQFYAKTPIRGRTDGIAKASDPPYRPATPALP